MSDPNGSSQRSLWSWQYWGVPRSSQLAASATEAVRTRRATRMKERSCIFNARYIQSTGSALYTTALCLSIPLTSFKMTLFYQLLVLQLLVWFPRCDLCTFAYNIIYSGEEEGVTDVMTVPWNRIWTRDGSGTERVSEEAKRNGLGGRWRCSRIFTKYHIEDWGGTNYGRGKDRRMRRSGASRVNRNLYNRNERIDEN